MRKLAVLAALLTLGGCAYTLTQTEQKLADEQLAARTQALWESSRQKWADEMQKSPEERQADQRAAIAQQSRLQADEAYCRMQSQATFAQMQNPRAFLQLEAQGWANMAYEKCMNWRAAE